MATAAKKPVKKAATHKKAVKPSAPRAASRAVATTSKGAFMQTKFTEQSLYWLVFGMSVVALALWAVSLQIQLNSVYDTMSTSDSTVLSSKKAQ